jgi:hypothetical protein
MMLGQGRAAAITNNDMAALAIGLGCHPAALEAIAEVESAGFGWFDDGRIKILPEPHKFYSALPDGRRAVALKAGLAFKTYAQTKASGHYKRMTNKPGPRYDFLARMIEFDAGAAYEAISVGKFQIMGFNAETCGFPSAKAMFDAFVDSEVNQLRAFGQFLVKNGLRPALKAEDFAQVETTYNGGGLGGVYAAHMKVECAKLKAGKWSGWPHTWPGKADPAPLPPPVITAPPVVAPPAPVKPVAPVTPTTPAPVAPMPPTAAPARPVGFWSRFIAALAEALSKKAST